MSWCCMCGGGGVVVGDVGVSVYVGVGVDGVDYGVGVVGGAVGDVGVVDVGVDGGYIDVGDVGGDDVADVDCVCVDNV